MNRLTLEERTRIIYLLCEGTSIRAIAHLTGASKNTVAKLLVDAGKACDAYHNANVRHLKAASVHVDEIWSFTRATQKNEATARDVIEGAGDTWTWIAIDRDSKMILSYFVGKRDDESAAQFMDDLASRLTNRTQLTSKAHRAYLEGVEGAFGCDVDYAKLAESSPRKLYSPAESADVRKRAVEGKPDDAHVPSSLVEHQNLTMRMHARRFTRVTNASSKKVENHAHAVALHIMYYNFVRIHKTRCVTPAMAAGVTDRLWGIADIALLVERAEIKSGRCAPYRQREVSN